MITLFCLALLWYFTGLLICCIFACLDDKAVTLFYVLTFLAVSVFGPLLALFYWAEKADNIVLWRRRK